MIRRLDGTLVLLSLALVTPLLGARQAPVAPSLSPVGVTEAVLVGAGDIARCRTDGAERTALLLDSVPGTVFTLGDHAYSSGTYEQFMDCYEPTWGRHKDRTRPVPGNHDYETPGAAAYFRYFGERAGMAGEGYYQYTLASWNIYALNSAVPADAASAQYKWLAGELAANRSACALAYWHLPVRTSSRNGDADEMLAVWRLLYEHGVDVVLAGHAHHYERFAPMDAAFARDEAKGIREFVVGTGGGSLYGFVDPKPHSEFRLSVWGVLKLVLRPNDYAWEFISAVDRRVRDAGTSACH